MPKASSLYRPTSNNPVCAVGKESTYTVDINVVKLSTTTILVLLLSMNAVPKLIVGFVQAPKMNRAMSYLILPVLCFEVGGKSIFLKMVLIGAAYRYFRNFC